MKKKLQIFALNLFFCSPTPSFRWAFALVALLGLSGINPVQAQCIGPYQEYQSFGTLDKAGLTAAGWSFSGLITAAPIPVPSNARSGNACLSVGNTIGNWLILPTAAFAIFVNFLA